MATCLRDSALAYLRAGLSVLPARLAEKRPVIPTWKDYAKRLPTEQEVRGWFNKDVDAICVVCGAVSGSLEMIDFDFRAEWFHRWDELVQQQNGALLDKIYIENSQSGGCHIAYHCESQVEGSTKLADRRIIVPGTGEYVYLGGGKARLKQEGDKKALKAVNEHGQWAIYPCLVETRGEGGLFLCAPSPKYEVVQGELARLPVLTADERETLLEAARSLNEHLPKPVSVPTRGADGRPGDDYNTRGDVRALLQKHGWTRIQEGENEHWCRPGKQQGTSATLKKGVFFVFTSNAPPFEPSRGYPPFAVFTLLEHGGDYSAAAKALHQQGYGCDSHGAASMVSGNGETATQAEFRDTARPIADLLNDPRLLNAPPRIPSTLKALDKALKGGFVRRAMYVLAGLTGRGKSLLCAVLARLLAKSGLRVLWFTLEDDDLAAARKVLAAESNVPILALENYQNPEATTTNERDRVQIARESLSPIPLFIDADTNDINAIELLVKLHVGRGATVILVDQSSWVHVPNLGPDSRTVEASEIARRLKRLAKELDIVVFVLVQINRQGASAYRDGQDLELYHIRDSGRWEEDADAVLIIQTLDESCDGAGVMHIDTKKHRPGGGRYRVQLRVVPSHGIVEDDPEHLEPENQNTAKVATDTASEVWTVDRFINTACKPTPEVKDAIIARATAADLSQKKAAGLFALALSEKRLYQWPRKGNAPATYATTAPPEPNLLNSLPESARPVGRPKRGKNAHGGK